MFFARNNQDLQSIHLYHKNEPKINYIKTICLTHKYRHSSIVFVSLRLFLLHNEER